MSEEDLTKKVKDMFNYISGQEYSWNAVAQGPDGNGDSQSTIAGVYRGVKEYMAKNFSEILPVNLKESNASNSSNDISKKIVINFEAAKKMNFNAFCESEEGKEWLAKIEKEKNEVLKSKEIDYEALKKIYFNI